MKNGYDPNKFKIGSSGPRNGPRAEAKRDVKTNLTTDQMCKDIKAGKKVNDQDEDYWRRICQMTDSDDSDSDSSDSDSSDSEDDEPKIKSQVKTKHNHVIRNVRSKGLPLGALSAQGIHPSSLEVSEGNPYVGSENEQFFGGRSYASYFNYRPNKNGHDWTDNMYGRGTPIVAREAGRPINPQKRGLSYEVSEEAFKPMHDTRINTGFMVNTYDGNVYETFEEEMPAPDFKRDTSLSKTDLTKTNPRLVMMNGGYDENRPPPRKKENANYGVQGPDAGRNPWGEQIYSDRLSQIQRHYASRDLFNNRNDFVPVEAVDDKQSMGFVGYEPNYRIYPVLTPTTRGLNDTGKAWHGGPDMGAAAPNFDTTRVMGPGQISKKKYDLFGTKPARAFAVGGEGVAATDAAGRRIDFAYEKSFNTQRATIENKTRSSNVQGEAYGTDVQRSANNSKIRANHGEATNQERGKNQRYRGVGVDGVSFAHVYEQKDSYDPYRSGTKGSLANAAIKNVRIDRQIARDEGVGRSAKYLEKNPINKAVGQSRHNQIDNRELNRQGARPSGREGPVRKDNYQTGPVSRWGRIENRERDGDGGGGRDAKRERRDPQREGVSKKIARDRPYEMDSDGRFDADPREIYVDRKEKHRTSYERKNKSFFDSGYEREGSVRDAKRDRVDPQRESYSRKAASMARSYERGDAGSYLYPDDPERNRPTRKDLTIKASGQRQSYVENGNDHGSAGWDSCYDESETDKRGLGREEPYLHTSKWTPSAFQSNDRVIFKNQFNQGSRACKKEIVNRETRDRGGDYSDFEVTSKRPYGYNRVNSRRPDDTINNYSGYDAYGIESWDE